MRVTNSMMRNSSMANISSSYSSLLKYKNQTDTGKLFTKPSDNPYGVAKTMDFEYSIKQNERYLKNMKDAQGFMKATEDALMDIHGAMQTIRELTVTASNDPTIPEHNSAIATEVAENVKLIAQAMNSTYNGKHIFAGFQTDKDPVRVVDGTIMNNNLDALGNDLANDVITIEVSKGLEVPINVVTSQIMGDPDMGGVLGKLQNDLLGLGGEDTGGGVPITQEKVSEYLDKMDAMMSNVSQLTTSIGVTESRFDSMIARNEQETLNLTQLHSDESEVDIEKAILKYAMMENIYNASMQTGAKVMQQNLLNYL